MVVRIRSLLISGPVLVPLNTGQTLRLSAGEVSGELPDVEVAQNAKVEKLLSRGAIAVEESGTPDDASEGNDDTRRARARGGARKPPGDDAPAAG